MYSLEVNLNPACILESNSKLKEEAEIMVKIRFSLITDRQYSKNWVGIFG